jgi:hypothetical protein
VGAAVFTFAESKGTEGSMPPLNSSTTKRMVLCAPAERPIEIVPEPEHPIPYHRDRRRCPLLETTVWIFA